MQINLVCMCSFLAAFFIIIFQIVQHTFYLIVGEGGGGLLKAFCNIWNNNSRTIIIIYGLKDLFYYNGVLSIPYHGSNINIGVL